MLLLQLQERFNLIWDSSFEEKDASTAYFSVSYVGMTTQPSLAHSQWLSHYISLLRHSSRFAEISNFFSPEFSSAIRYEQICQHR